MNPALPLILQIGLFWVVLAAESAASAAEERISDAVIDRAGQQVLEGAEFRSLRRRLLQQSSKPDLDDGFLHDSLKWISVQLSECLHHAGEFFQWLTGDLWTRQVPKMRPALNRRLPQGNGSPRFSSVLGVVVVVVILAILTAMIVLIVRTWDLRRGRKTSLPATSADVVLDITAPPGELAVSTYESRAARLAANGDFRSAVRELLLGGMSWIERSSLIRFRIGLTNRDYLRSVWRYPQQKSAWEFLALQFEYVYFGRRVPTREMFEACLASFRNAFDETEIQSLSV